MVLQESNNKVYKNVSLLYLMFHEVGTLFDCKLSGSRVFSSVKKILFQNTSIKFTGFEASSLHFFQKLSNHKSIL